MTRSDEAGAVPMSRSAPRIMRVVACFDLALAVAVIATPFLRTRFGVPITLMFAVPLFAGALFLFWFAARLARPPVTGS